MRETLTLALAWAAGAGLGALFFGGLWWTVRKGLSSRHPALLFSGSMLLRTAATLAGFYLIGGGHGDRLLLSLLGFVMACLVATRLTRSSGAGSPSQAREASHAPQS